MVQHTSATPFDDAFDRRKLLRTMGVAVVPPFLRLSWYRHRRRLVPVGRWGRQAR